MPRWPFIVVSYSELDSFRQCPHKHSLAYKQRWSPTSLSPALSKGILWHEIMAIHYQAIQAGASDSARREAVAERLAEAAQINEEEAGLIAWMYDGYEECYGTDPDWEVAAVEDQRLIRLPTATGRASRFWLRMRADLIVWVKQLGRVRKLWLVDHKSGQRLPSDKELDIDDQFGLYTWGLHQLGDPVFGSIYSAARTQRNVGPMALEDRFVRKLLYRTDREIETIAREAYVTARTAYRYGVDEAPRAPDSDRCRWRCPYTEACLLGRKAGNRAEHEFLSAGYEQLTEADQLSRRGYPEPLQPDGPH